MWADVGASQVLTSLKLKAVTESDLASLEELARKCYSRPDFEQVIQIIERIPVYPVGASFFRSQCLTSMTLPRWSSSSPVLRFLTSFVTWIVASGTGGCIPFNNRSRNGGSPLRCRGGSECLPEPENS
jgi:hypothetical protein